MSESFYYGTYVSFALGISEYADARKRTPSYVKFTPGGSKRRVHEHSRLVLSHRIPEMSGVSVRTLASALGVACSPITCGVVAYQTELS